MSAVVVVGVAVGGVARPALARGAAAGVHTATATTKPGGTPAGKRKTGVRPPSSAPTTTRVTAKTGSSSVPGAAKAATTTTTALSEAVRREGPTIRALVERNFAALNDEDLNSSMATIDPDSDAFAETRRVTQSVFEEFDLKVTLETFELKSVSGDTAVARVVQRTEKLRGPDFKNNRITADWEFRRAKGTWYISGQVILETKPLE